MYELIDSVFDLRGLLGILAACGAVLLLKHLPGYLQWWEARKARKIQAESANRARVRLRTTGPNELTLVNHGDGQANDVTVLFDGKTPEEYDGVILLSDDIESLPPGGRRQFITMDETVVQLSAQVKWEDGAGEHLWESQL